MLGVRSGPHTVAICKWYCPKHDVILEQVMALRLYDVVDVDVGAGVGMGDGGGCCRIMFILRA